MPDDFAEKGLPVKHIATSALCISLALALSGCASLKKGTSFNGLELDGENPVAHYNARNWGLYLLSIPLLTGDPAKADSLINTTVLSDTVNVDALADAVTAAAHADGATEVTDMVSSRSSVWIPPLLVVFYKSATMSANGVR